MAWSIVPGVRVFHEEGIGCPGCFQKVEDNDKRSDDKGS
jgi:hypothetical protein